MQPPAAFQRPTHMYACMPVQLDTAVLRPQHYREKWAEEADRRWAEELQMLIGAERGPTATKPAAATASPTRQ
jgi:hypothetical protein